jgi:hypothetical protein
MPPQHDRPSVSPANGMNGVPQLQRQASDYYLNAMSGGMAAVPAHLRNDMQQSTRPQSPAQYTMPVNQPQARPVLTSNPSANYNSRQGLEQPTTNGQQQATNGNNSPHMNANIAWQPSHNGIPTTQTTEYTYPDHTAYSVANVNAPMYYQQGNVQRPHSTGPIDHYGQMRGQEMWAQHQQ